MLKPSFIAEKIGHIATYNIKSGEVKEMTDYYTMTFRMDSTAAQKHNTREWLTREIDHPERTADNITLCHIDCREAYQEIFGRAIEEYNSRQKRPDRQIKYDGRGYYDKLLKRSFNKSTKQGNKAGHQHPYYETIVQIGDKDNHPDEQTAIQCMRDYFEHWKADNKNLFVVGAYIHLDENTPHMHIDYVPVAEMKKGMKFQNGLNKAFEQLMGYQSKNAHDTAQQQFQQRERDVLRDICRARGLEIEATKHNDRKHLTVEQYKEQKIADEMEIIRAIEKTEISDQGKQTILQRLTKSDSTTIKSTELERLKQQARAGQGKEQVIKDLQEELKDTKAENAKFRQGIAREQQSIRDKKQYIDSKEKELRERIDRYNKVKNGEAYQEAVQQLRNIQGTLAQERAELEVVRAERTTLQKAVDELKQAKNSLIDWLNQNIKQKYERLFCQRHKAEYQEFEQQQDRNRSWSR